MSGFAFEQNKGYCVVRFETDLHEMSWGDVENEAAEIVQKIKAANMSRMIVDLSPMDLIQSGLVASLVRMWKATEGSDDRKVVVATPNEVVRDVIRSAGLFKVFTVVNSREEGAYEIGVSKGAQLEQREKRVVAWVALPAAILSAVALYAVFNMQDMTAKDNAELAAALLAAFACISSLFSVAKDEGWRRGCGALALIVGLGVIGSLYMDGRLPGVPASEVPEGEEGAPEESLGEPADASAAESSLGPTFTIDGNKDGKPTIPIGNQNASSTDSGDEEDADDEDDE